MARRNDHSREEIHQMALEAAERILDEGGQKALSARKIAGQIGYTVGTLYLVFDNLNDLILQINGRTLDLLARWMSERVGEMPPGAAKLHGLAQAYISFAEHYNPRWNLLFDHSFEQNREMPDWYQQRLASVFGMVEQALPAIGEASDPTARVRIARVLWASVHGICMLKIRQRMTLAGGQSTEQMTELLIDHFLAGMGAGER